MESKVLPREAGVKRKINGVPVTPISPALAIDAITACQALYATAKVFIGGLSATTTENHLRTHFSAFGDVSINLSTFTVVLVLKC